MNDHTFISAFTPSRTRPEDLEAIHVQRHEMMDDAIDRIHESATTGNKHHLLFVGPRGTGKTHLVTLLVHRLSQDSELEKHLRIAWLNEDETCTTLLEFLRRIYLALIKRHPDEYTEKSLEPIFDLEPDEAERWIARQLLEKLQNRTLLVIVENLDALFEGLGESGQQKLRAFIQENPVLSLVATAQRLVDDITKRKSAFFGFFQTEQLKTLSVEQAAELLEKIATLNGQTDVAAFLHSATGSSRVKALHHLSGGNHRIYIVLSQFITSDSINALVEPFSKMVDEMTPYYQERIRWLPTQQRKIVEYLCTCERPTPVKEVARRLFASQQTISSQLNDLRKKGYVQAAQRGRESLYEIAEPLMRICVEVKENQSHEPLRMLVDFLRVWYDGRELSTRLKECASGSMAHAYLESAIEKNSEQGNLRTQLLVEGFRAELSNERGLRWNSRIESYAQESEELALACGEWVKGKDAQALTILSEITGRNSGSSTRIIASAWMLFADIHDRRGDQKSAIKGLNSILELADVPIELVARALVSRGLTYRQLGDTEKAIIDYSAVLDLAGTPVEHVARALIIRGLTYKQLGDLEKEIADYSAVLDLADAPVENIVLALINLGAIYGQLGDTEKAIANYSAVLDLADAPVTPVALALLGRGLTYGQLGDPEKAIADYSAVLDLADAPVEHVTRALIIRGLTYKQLGDLEKAIADYSAALDLADAPVEYVALAFLGRGLTYGQLEDPEKAIADYSAVLDLADVPVEHIARALMGRGLAYGQRRDLEKAIADYSAVLDLTDAPLELVAQALMSRGLAYGQLEDPEKEIADYSAVLDLADVPVEHIARALMSRGLAYGQRRDLEKSIADYSAVLDLTDAPVELVARALMSRGLTYGPLGDPEKEIADYSAVLDLADAPVEHIAFALYNRGAAYRQLNYSEKSEIDFEAVLRLEGALVALQVDSNLALAEIRMGDGRWDSAVSALTNGLRKGSSHASPYLGNSKDVIRTFFESTVTSKVRQKRTQEVAQIYRDNNATAQLGDALVEHLGSLYASSEDLPTSDSLEYWASGWEDAANNVGMFELPLRIFRTGIDFLKSGGKNRGILLDLNQEERKILEQALNIDPIS